MFEDDIQKPSADSLAATGSTGWRILLVEDNSEDRRIATRILKKYHRGTHVIEADTGVAALRCLESNEMPFDCVLLDLKLPDMSGGELLAQLTKTNIDVPPIIVLTGIDRENLGDELIREGAQDYLVKGPTLASLLCRTIRYAIERQMYARIQSANQCRSEFISIVSREIRDPITSILLLSKVLTEHRDGDVAKERVKFASTIHTCAETVASAVDEIVMASGAGRNQERSVLRQDGIDRPLQAQLHTP